LKRVLAKATTSQLAEKRDVALDVGVAQRFKRWEKREK
jgi:hypothetical protein